MSETSEIRALLIRATDDTIVGWTRGAAQLSGFEAGEVEGRVLHELLPEAHVSGERLTLHGKEGRRVPVTWIATPVHDQHGRLVAFTDVLIPVDAVDGRASVAPAPAREPAPPERAAGSMKDAQPALPEGEAVFLHVLESLPMLCWTADPDGRCRFMSSRWAEYTGLPTARLLGTGWSEVVHPDDLEAAAIALRHAHLSPPGRPLLELRIRRHDGVYRWFEVRVSAEYDACSQPVRWFGATIDVHAMHLAREALKREREHLTRIVAAAPGAFYSCRQAPDGTLSLPHVSVAMQQLLGLTPELLNAGLADLAHVHPDDHARVRESIEVSARDLLPWQLDFRMLNPERGTLWVHGHAMPTREPDGTVQWFGFLEDITERKRAEDVRLRAQKLEAVGTLAGGIAHDFNNMLHAISGNCALALRELPPAHPTRARLESALVAGNRASELVHRLLQFSRPSSTHRDVLPLRGLVREALRLVRATVPARIEIHEELDRGAVDDELYVEVDPTDVHQLVLQLAANAVHAIGEASGALYVRIERALPDAAQLPAQPGTERPGIAALHVRDTGRGIDPGAVARVFDPFFTTKQLGEGAGLGLSLVHGIMSGLGGSVSVHSTPGEGSTFTLYFPLRAAPEPPRRSARDSAAERGGCVLLVDDEPLLVELGTHVLESLGYVVLAFTSPRAALGAFFREPDAIDVVITDLAMPDLSGIEVAKRLLEVRPNLPIVMMSGNVGSEDLATARRLGLQQVLLKPVSVETLAATVREAMGAARTRAGSP